MRIDVELLLDRVPLLREVGVLPGEVIDRIEREGLATSPSRSPSHVKRWSTCGVDDAGPSDEPARGDEMLVDARQRIVPPRILPVAVERCSPEWRRGHAVREQLIVGAAARGLEVERVEFAKHERSVDVGDAVGPLAIGSIGVRRAEVRLVAEVACDPRDGVDRM